METIHHEGREYSVREDALFKAWLCRVLIANDGAVFLEYVVSVGPYKTDIPVVYALSPEDAVAYKAGALDVGILVRTLRERAEATGQYERRNS